MTTDLLEKAHPRMLVRGLMRGFRQDFKRGYSATNAAICVRDIKKRGNCEMQEADVEILIAYAQGYGDGMHWALTRSESPVREFANGFQSEAYREGVLDGKMEDAETINPTWEA